MQKYIKLGEWQDEQRKKETKPKLPRREGLQPKQGESLVETISDTFGNTTEQTRTALGEPLQDQGS